MEVRALMRVEPKPALESGKALDPEKPDEQLMLDFKKGDASAFEVLVRRHRTEVFNYILRFTGDSAKAQDVLQETWLRVIRSATAYEPKARFTTWVYTLARNLCVDSSRKESLRRADSLDGPSGRDEEDPPLSDRLPDDRPNPESAAHASRIRPLLERALRLLPDEQREVFLLREFSGIPFSEIAQVTGVSENTVKSRMRYALQSLRKHLRELGIDDESHEAGRTAAG